MMTRNLFIDALRMIKRTKTKFISLFAIVALGVSFFVGISATSPIMGYSVDQYNDEYSLMDIEVYSNYGFDKDDISAISNLEGVVAAEGRKFIDAVLTGNETNFVTRVIGYNGNNQVNQVRLLDGRLPENESECVVGVPKEFIPSLDIGTQVSVSLMKDDLTETLNNTNLTVVGIVETPEFLHGNNGISSLSNQFIVYYLFVPEENFKVDYYSSVLVLAEDTKKYNSFESGYETVVLEYVKKIEDLGLSQAQARKDKIEQEALDEYNEGLLEYEDGKETAKEELEEAMSELLDAQRKIRDVRKELKDGKISIADAKILLDEELQNGYDELNLAQGQLDVGRNAFNSAEKEFEEGQKQELLLQRNELSLQLNGLLQVQEGLNQMNESIANLESQKSQLEARKNELEAMGTLTDEERAELEEVNNSIVVLDETIVNLQAQKQALINSLNSPTITDEVSLNGNIIALQQGIEVIDNGLSSAQAELDAQRSVLDQAAKEIEQGYINLEWEIDKARQEIAEKEKEILTGEKELKDAEQELADGWEEYEQAKEDVEQEFADAEEELKKAKEDIDTLDDGEWIVLDRTMHYSSKAYMDTVTQMQQIARIFPLFFIFVAALVCSTTMTRMIDEQRGQIGTLRSLGYSKLACTAKYLLYATIATVGGSIVGVITGLSIFPPIIYDTWGMMYQLPPMKFYVSIPMILMTVISFFLVMVGTTYLAARKEMKEKTSQLLRPKPPTVGKRILIERVTFFWNRLSFTSKVTVRNIFRYKKRFFMTTLGIGGCTALLVAAFGLRGSIATVVDREFNELYHNDGYIQIESNLTENEKEILLKDLIQSEGVSEVRLSSAYSAVVKNLDGKEESVTVTIFEDDQEMKEVRNVLQRKSSEEISLKNNEVLINEKLAILFKLSIGDTLILEGENGEFKEVIVGGIFESYVNHNVYITKEYYEERFQTSISENSVFIKVDGEINNQELIDIEHVESLHLFEPVITSFEDMIVGMDVVVYVLILSAGLLAFIVLGNLTSVNISERQREIATLKVLGFNRKEINSYIYKENLLLVTFGIFLGFIMGALLHGYVIVLVEMDFVMFGRDISWEWYMFSALMTYVFAAIVNIIVSFTLRKIKMVESLKSVE